MYFSWIIIVLFTLLGYCRSNFQNTSHSPSNDKISLFLNHFQIFKDLLPHNGDSKPKIKETRPLIQVLRDGVPVNFNRVPALIIRKNITTITLEPPITTATALNFLTANRNEYFRIGSTTSRADPLYEIKRLEELVLNLKKEMLDQQEQFKNELLKIYQPSPIQRNLITPTITSLIETTKTSFSQLSTSSEIIVIPESLHHVEVQTTEIGHVTHHHKSEKIHPKDIWNKKNPPNSVLIVPQFKYHHQHATATPLAYSKPKQIMWTNFPTTTPHIFYENNHFLFNHEQLARSTSVSDDIEEYEIVQEMTDTELEESDTSDEVQEVQTDKEVIERTFLQQARLNRPRPTFEDPFVDLQTIMTVTMTNQTLEDSYIPRSSRRKGAKHNEGFNEQPSFKFDVFDWIFENTGNVLNNLQMVIVIGSLEMVLLYLL